MSTTKNLKKWTPEEKKIVFDHASNLDLTPTNAILAASANLPDRTRGAVEYQYYNETQYLVPGRRLAQANAGENSTAPTAAGDSNKRMQWTRTNVSMLKHLMRDPQHSGKSQTELATLATQLFPGVAITAIAKKISKIKLAMPKKKKKNQVKTITQSPPPTAVRALVKWKGREDAIIKKAHKQNPNVSQTQLTKLVTPELTGRSAPAIQSRVSMLLRSKPNVSVVVEQPKQAATKHVARHAELNSSDSMGLTLPFTVKNIVFRGGNAIDINGSESDHGVISVSINEEHNCLTIKTGGKIAYVSVSAPGEAVVKF